MRFYILILLLLPLGVFSQGEKDSLFDLDLGELKTISIKSGSSGGFGKQLEDLGIKPYVHGYMAAFYRTNDLNNRRNNKTFNMHYFNPIFGANIGNKVVAEMMAEYEHGGSSIELRYALVDWSPSKYLTLRIGKFLMPMGRFNEYLYPEYINKLANRPINLHHIVPVAWAEAGVQVRGRADIDSAKGIGINYAVYCVNGLQGAAGTDIRGMRNNNRDFSNDEKSFGGRLGIMPYKNIEIGASYYTGKYTPDGKLNIAIMALGAGYSTEKIHIYGEFTQAQQDTNNGKITKTGFFAEAGYKITKNFEPVVRYDEAEVPKVAGYGGKLNTEKIQRFTAGLIYYPQAKLLSRFNFKFNYCYILNDGSGAKGEEIIFQVALGF